MYAEYGGLPEGHAVDDKESVMRDTIIGRILMYLAIWVVLFFILCVVSVIKNWSVLVATLSSVIFTLIVAFFVAGLIIYAIVMMTRALFR